MKPKHIIILALVFVALFLSVLIKKSFMKPEVELSEYKKVELSLDPDGISAIEMKDGSGEETLRLEKRDSDWVMPLKWDLAAKQFKVEEFLKSISTLQGEVRANKSALFGDFGIADNEAFSLVFYGMDGAILENILVGLVKPGPGESFIRRSGSDDIILVDKDIYTLMGIYKDPKEAGLNEKIWLELAFINFEVDDIESLSIEHFEGGQINKTVAVSKVLDEDVQMKQWVADMETLFPIDARKIRTYLRSLKGQAANDICDPQGVDYGFEDPYLTLILETGYGKLEYPFGSLTGEGETSRYVKTPQDAVYIIGEYPIKQIDIDISEFFVDDPLGIDEGLELIRIKSEAKEIELNKALIEENAEYIAQLKKFSVKRLVSGPEYKGGLKGSTDYSLILTKSTGDVITVLAVKISDDDYYAEIEGARGVFALEKDLFEDLFLKLESIKESVEPQ